MIPAPNQGATMSHIPYRSALIIGAGPGISASVTRMLRAADIPVVIAARRTDKLDEIGRAHV